MRMRAYEMFYELFLEGKKDLNETEADDLKMMFHSWVRASVSLDIGIVSCIIVSMALAIESIHLEISTYLRSYLCFFVYLYRLRNMILRFLSNLLFIGYKKHHANLIRFESLVYKEIRLLSI